MLLDGRVKRTIILLASLVVAQAGPPKISPFEFTENAVGREVKVFCVCSGMSSLTWSKNGRPLSGAASDAGISIKQLEGALMLSISDLQPEHSGNYTCTARNKDGTSSFSAQLEVAAPPTWLKTPAETIRLGASPDVELVCEASGFPTPIISWKKDGDIVLGGRVLRLPSGQSSTAGEYVCLASNIHGSISHKFKVSVVCE